MSTAPVVRASSLDQHIETAPDIRGGRPRVAGSRITVADIVLMHLRMGQALAEIAGTYELPLSSVHAAMAWYYDHSEEIDASIESDEAVFEAFRKANPSPLQEKLRMLKGG